MFKHSLLSAQSVDHLRPEFTVSFTGNGLDAPAEIRKIAEDVVVAQTREIKQVEAWLATKN